MVTALVESRTATTMLHSGYTVMESWTSDGVKFTSGEVAAQALRLRPNWGVQLGGSITLLDKEVGTYLGANAGNLVTEIRDITTVGEVIFTVVVAESSHDGVDGSAIESAVDGALNVMRKRGLVSPDFSRPRMSGALPRH